TTEELSISWEAIKRQERKEKAEQADVKMHILDDIGSNMPAVMRAEKLQLRAASVGFDWEDSEPVMAKIEEELLELKTELYGSAQAERLSEEMGDLLFSCINLARHIKVEPELALRQANRKFEQRFRFIEEQLSEQGLALQDASLEQMEAYWQAAKNKDI
ncbi:MAG: MazG family protein, partial [Gammaproteobacteria bacterium]|nr:MazG family protein [Gammaproteobacteria bacterium]